MNVLRITVLVVAVDQLLKALAAGGIVRSPWIIPAHNADFALGLAGGPAATELLLGTAALIVAAAWGRRRTGHPLFAVAGALVLGGAVSNLIDRAVRGSVLDFLVGPGILFNPADIALLVGAAAWIVATRAGVGPLSGSASARRP